MIELWNPKEIVEAAMRSDRVNARMNEEWVTKPAAIAAVRKVLALQSWMPIDSHPTTDHEPFMVLLPKNDIASFVQLQVSVFEGWMYPDHLDGCIDWNDRVLNATHWAPCLPVPAMTDIKRPTPPPSTSRGEWEEKAK